MAKILITCGIVIAGLVFYLLNQIRLEKIKQKLEKLLDEEEKQLRAMTNLELKLYYRDLRKRVRYEAEQRTLLDLAERIMRERQISTNNSKTMRI